MAKLSAAQEPSMEEILASIRRIISEDDAELSAPPAPRPAQPQPAPPSLSTDSIDALFAARAPAPKPSLQPEPRFAQGSPQPAAARPVEPTVALRPTIAPSPRPSVPPRSEPASQPARDTRPAPTPPIRHEEPAAERPLLSAGANAAVHAAFGSLGAAPPVNGSSGALEELVKEALRPMLKAWLDLHLPPLVERLVREEIERASRGR